MLKNRVALGFRAHSGWAAVVALAEPIDAPRMILRRHLTLTAGPKQPYHAAAEMALPDAEAFIARCTESCRALAEKAVADLLEELGGMGLKTAGSSLLLASGRPAGELAGIIASHPLIHTAEGEFYRNAVRNACESCGIPCVGIKEKELLGHKYLSLVSQWGRTMGPPWRQDQKLCAAAAWRILSQSQIVARAPSPARIPLDPLVS